MSLINLLSEYLILPVSDIITGQSISRHLKFLLKSQWWDNNQINEFQEERLSKLIKHCVETVPYYNSLFHYLGLRADDIKSKDDLKKLPLLTKAIIKKEGIKRFTSSAISDKDRLNKSSSGSTGEPLFYYDTRESYSMNIAANLRGWYWMGYRIGDKYIKLSQNQRKNNLKRIQDKVSRNLYLATNPLNESNFEFILNKIEKYKPKIIRCYPDPLLFLAHFKKGKPKYKFVPLAITTTGNTLHPEARSEIESAFGCKIFDSYSCEGNSNVFECPTHECYHSADEYGISEIIDENGQPVSKGIGKLISTDLWNFAHPFIRYDTQDLVEVDSERCKCGRNHLRILRIIGRENEILKMKSGRYFIVHNFTGFFQTDISEINRSIDQFQIVKNEECVTFSLVVNNRFSATVANYICKYWEKELGTVVKVEVVEHIPLTESGKRKFIINE